MIGYHTKLPNLDAPHGVNLMDWLNIALEKVVQPNITGSTKEQAPPSNSLKNEEGNRAYSAFGLDYTHQPSFSVPQKTIIFNCNFHHYKLKNKNKRTRRNVQF